MKINNCSELWSQWMFGEKESETHAQQLLRKWIFRGTECGCVFDSDEKGIKVGGYNELVESSELPTYDLEWGFTIEEFKEALDYADKEGCIAWHEAHEQDLASVVDEDMITEEEWNEENNKSDA
jgi:3-dehydroquinate dehydratase